MVNSAFVSCIVIILLIIFMFLLLIWFALCLDRIKFLATIFRSKKIFKNNIKIFYNEALHEMQHQDLVMLKLTGERRKLAVTLHEQYNGHDYDFKEYLEKINYTVEDIVITSVERYGVIYMMEYRVK